MGTFGWLVIPTYVPRKYLFLERYFQKFAAAYFAKYWLVNIFKAWLYMTTRMDPKFGYDRSLLERASNVNSDIIVFTVEK